MTHFNLRYGTKSDFHLLILDSSHDGWFCHTDLSLSFSVNFVDKIRKMQNFISTSNLSPGTLLFGKLSKPLDQHLSSQHQQFLNGTSVTLNCNFGLFYFSNQHLQHQETQFWLQLVTTQKYYFTKYCCIISEPRLISVLFSFTVHISPRVNYGCSIIYYTY